MRPEPRPDGHGPRRDGDAPPAGPRTEPQQQCWGASVRSPYRHRTWASLPGLGALVAQASQPAASTSRSTSSEADHKGAAGGSLRTNSLKPLARIRQSHLRTRGTSKPKAVPHFSSFFSERRDPVTDRKQRHEWQLKEPSGAVGNGYWESNGSAKLISSIAHDGVRYMHAICGIRRIDNPAIGLGASGMSRFGATWRFERSLRQTLRVAVGGVKKERRA